MQKTVLQELIDKTNLSISLLKKEQKKRKEDDPIYVGCTAAIKNGLSHIRIYKRMLSKEREQIEKAYRNGIVMQFNDHKTLVNMEKHSSVYYTKTYSNE